MVAEGMAQAVPPSLDDFQCAICWSLLYNPVVGPCGHDFCEPCYSACVASQDRTPKCPLCRRLLSHRLPDVCKRLQMTIMALFPEEAKARERAHQMPLNWEEERAAWYSGRGDGSATAPAAQFCQQPPPSISGTQTSVSAAAGSQISSSVPAWLQGPPLGSCVFTLGFSPPESGRRRSGVSSRHHVSCASNCSQDGRGRLRGRMRTSVRQGPLQLPRLRS